MLSTKIKILLRFSIQNENCPVKILVDKQLIVEIWLDGMHQNMYSSFENFMDNYMRPLYKNITIFCDWLVLKCEKF